MGLAFHSIGVICGIEDHRVDSLNYGLAKAILILTFGLCVSSMCKKNGPWVLPRIVILYLSCCHLARRCGIAP